MLGNSADEQYTHLYIKAHKLDCKHRCCIATKNALKLITGSLPFTRFMLLHEYVPLSTGEMSNTF